MGAGGLLIGRQRDCDIIVNDPSISRRHALIRVSGDTAELVPLGRTPVVVNGKLRTRSTPLSNGDHLELPGASLTIALEVQRPDRDSTTGFALARARGGVFGMSHSPFVVGGGDKDDLIVKGWRANALRFHVAQGGLFLEATVRATVNGEEIDPQNWCELSPGDAVSFRKESFRIERTIDGRTTVVADRTALPHRVTVQILPRGGRIVFSFADGDRAVFLADRRLDLFVALLRPPQPYQPGDFIPDDVVRTIVWPRNPGVSRPEINMLISRSRRDLVEAGMHGLRLLNRAPGGGATRLCLADGAIVSTD